MFKLEGFDHPNYKTGTMNVYQNENNERLLSMYSPFVHSS